MKARRSSAGISTRAPVIFCWNDGQEARFDRLLVGTYFEVTEVNASQQDFYTYFTAADWVERKTTWYPPKATS
jgi:hypothetical protein